MINTLKHNVFSDNADFFDFTKMNLKEGRRKKQKYRMEMSLEWYFRPHLMPSGQKDGSFCDLCHRARSFKHKKYDFLELKTTDAAMNVDFRERNSNLPSSLEKLSSKKISDFTGRFSTSLIDPSVDLSIT